MKIANVLISDSWGEVSPEAFNRGIGGREGAMIFLSREWANQGHEVTNFANVENSIRLSGTPKTVDDPIGYHEYIPLKLTKPVLTNFPYDVVIAWECPSLFKNNDIKTKLKMCEMQVCHLSNEEAMYADKHCDYVAALSNWHKEFMLNSFLDMSPDQVVIFPNGVDISRYPRTFVDEKIGLKPNSSLNFVYSSSPDRGLWQLLQSWPYIRESFPGSELRVGYGVKNWVQQIKWSHNRVGQMASEIEKLMVQTGVTDIGKIGQDELAKLQLDADAWLYPLDAIQATESGCITAVENAAAGNPIITTDCDCMETEFGPVGVIAELPFDPKEFAQCVEYVMSDEQIVKTLRKDGREFAEGRDWSIISRQWTDFFKENV